MAISCEKVYSGTGDQVYPETADKAVKLTSYSENGQTLDAYIDYLERTLSKLNGAEAIAKSLQFKITYMATNISDVEKIRELEKSDQWGENFQLPTVSSPYIWKKTIVVYKGGDDTSNSTPFYEVVTADTAEISQTLYKVQNNSKTPIIKYPQIASTDKEGEVVNIDNVNATLDEIIQESNKDNDNWSKVPSEISAANPYGFIAVRTRLQGKWSKFAVALNAKWSYDSTIDIRYTITQDANIPAINRTEVNPGALWTEDNSTEFTGYLWMTTATISNNNYIADSNKNYWSSPKLISIVK